MKKVCRLLFSWLLILAVSYTAMELTVLHWLPRVFPVASVMGYLDQDMRVLEQYSKNSVTPENYIAILGDSYAFGLGDWLLGNHSQVEPIYNATHLLHNSTGRDVVSFGMPASSNIRGYIEEPFSQLAFINALGRNSIHAPETALLYFYEGNDVTDNWEEFTVRYQGAGYARDKLNQQENFTLFIDEEILSKNKAMVRTKNISLADKLLFGRFAISLLEGESLKFYKDMKFKLENKVPHRMFKPIPRNHNTVFVAGENVFIPDQLQVPPITLHPDEISVSMTVLDQTLRYMKRMWPNTTFGMIYIPAVGTVYNVTSDTVNIYIYDKDRGENYPTSLLLPASDAACQHVQDIAKSNGIYFLDSRSAFREAAHQKLLHGPVDWFHFNETGYRVLATELEQLLAHLSSGDSTLPCATLAH